jgi:hypothetical protein
VNPLRGKGREVAPRMVDIRRTGGGPVDTEGDDEARVRSTVIA